MPDPETPGSTRPPRARLSSPPGWYDDGTNTSTTRWWNGTGWTTKVATGRLDRGGPTISTWIVGAVVLVFVLIFLLMDGVHGLAVTIAWAAILTGIYALISGRRSWALIHSRRVAGIVIAASIALFVASSAIPEPNAVMQSAASSTDVAHPANGIVVKAKPHTSPTPSPSAHPSGPASVSVSSATISTTSALSLLSTLPVKPALSTAGYNRTGDFGAAWLDEDHNGCDTRNDILSRDLTKITKSGVCKVVTGVLVSPYTGSTISFLRGEKTSALVQIDHLVALGDAWETGAQALSQAQRETLANDPLELMAVDGRSNDVKGDKDASQWLPPNAAFDCTYVARQISVKVTYSLWVTPAEHSAMASVLSKCGDITGTASPFAKTSVVPQPSTTSAAPAPLAVPAPTVVHPAPVAPAPVVSAPVVPAPVVPAPPPAPTTPVVHPGAFCAAALAGQHGVTSTGTSMICETSPTDTRLRWRAG
jgi:Protein of unknown function (DUF1524)/Protein of unknown function (DUF2510)